jgi:ubiquinone/menaquinone biosynthesis C-methylase UbiE
MEVCEIMASLEIGSNGPSKICDVGADLSTLVAPDIVLDVHNLPFRNLAFSSVYASHVFEHLDNPNQATQEVLRVTSNALIVLPNTFHPISWYYPLLTKHYIGRHTHVYLMNRYIRIPKALMAFLSLFRLMIQKPIFRHIWKKFFDAKFQDYHVQYGSAKG